MPCCSAVCDFAHIVLQATEWKEDREEDRFILNMWNSPETLVVWHHEDVIGADQMFGAVCELCFWQVK